MGGRAPCRHPHLGGTGHHAGQFPPGGGQIVGPGMDPCVPNGKPVYESVQVVTPSGVPAISVGQTITFTIAGWSTDPNEAPWMVELIDTDYGPSVTEQKGSLDVKMAAHALLGRACAGLKDANCAAAHYETVRAPWKDPAAATKAERRISALTRLKNKWMETGFGK